MADALRYTPRVGVDRGHLAGPRDISDCVARALWNWHLLVDARDAAGQSTGRPPRRDCLVQSVGGEEAEAHCAKHSIADLISGDGGSASLPNWITPQQPSEGTFQIGLLWSARLQWGNSSVGSKQMFCSTRLFSLFLRPENTSFASKKQ